jgi:hypothetical protein
MPALSTDIGLGGGSVVECLPSRRKALDSILRILSYIKKPLQIDSEAPEAEVQNHT